MTLTVDGLLGAAEAEAGRSDWGDDSFLAGLTVFVEAFEALDRQPAERDMARAVVTGLLTDRLRWVADHTAHPEILDIEIERPVIVIGMPRTGTTLLYDLLATDPAARAPRYWETRAVWPAPDVGTYDTDPRIDAARQEVAMTLEIAPSLADMIPVGATLPAECNRFMVYHFWGTELGTMFGLPLHDEWTKSGQCHGMYDTHRRILQQLSWKGPTGRWTLKSPVHLFTLDDLVEAYPDACLVWTHRPPLNVFTSLVDLIDLCDGMRGQRRPKQELGDDIIELYGTALDRGMASRERPDIEARVLDLAFSDVRSDPTGAVRRIHEHFALPFTGVHEQAMKAFLAAHPKGSHELDPASAGYTEERMRERFGSYYERFAEFLS